jgi:hypothetical protein
VELQLAELRRDVLHAAPPRLASSTAIGSPADTAESDASRAAEIRCERYSLGDSAQDDPRHGAPPAASSPADGRPGPAAPRRRSSMRSAAQRGSRRPIGRTSGKDLPATRPRERPRGRPQRRSPPVPRVGGLRRGSERAPSATRRR